MTVHEQGTWARELSDFVRAFSGAYLFGVPLLFTMEVWWIGIYGDRWKLVTFLGFALVANVGLTYVAGFKREENSLGACVSQAIEVVAVGIVAATAMLLVLNRISPSEPLDSALGKIIIQAVPLSIGASVANEIFGEREGGRQGEQSGHQQSGWQAFLSDTGATAIGCIFIGFSIAPTEEVPMLAASMDFVHMLMLVAFTLLLGYGIVFESGFDRQQSTGLFQRPITETVLAYLISVAISLIVLFFFDQIEFGDPLRLVVAETLVIALPATVGGAAGRLVL